MIFKAIRSNADFNIKEEPLQISYAITRGIQEDHKTNNFYDNTCKQFILTKNNSDNFCFPRSSVTTHEYAIRGQIREGKLDQY